MLQAITWTEASFRALKLILMDILWSLVSIVVVLPLMMIILPNYHLCSLLQSETGIEENPHLPKTIILSDMFRESLYFTMYLFVFLVLVEPCNQSLWWKNLAAITKKYRKSIISTILLILVNGIYKVLMFLIFKLKDNNNYPWWYRLPGNFIWIAGAYYSCTQLAQIWGESKKNALINLNLPLQLVESITLKLVNCLCWRVLISLILTAIKGFVMRELVLVVLSISEEKDRAVLIGVTLMLYHAVRLLLDQEAKKLLPWPKEIHKSLQSSSVDHKQDLSPYEKHDPVAHNGIFLSVCISTCTVTTVRILQANMETLTSKIITGVLSSIFQSILVIAKPYFVKMGKKIMRQSKKCIMSWKKDRHITPLEIRGKYSNDYTENKDRAQEDVQDEVELVASKSRIFKWYRGQSIVLINRLEVFSIIYGHALLVMSSLIKKNAQGSVESFHNSSRECDFPDVNEYILTMVLLCSVESIIEFCTYVYVIKVEGLNIDKTTRRTRFGLCFLYNIIFIAFFFVDTYLSMGYTLLSCDGMDEIFYRHHCF